jgi:hypothetical protein
MRSNVTFTLGILCAGLAVGGGYSLHLLDVEKDLTASESAARSQAEARVKELQTQLATLKINYSAPRQDGAPAVAAGPTNYSAAYQSERAQGSPYGRFQRREMGGMGGMPGMQRFPGLNPDLIKALRLSEADAAKLTKIFEDRQAKIRQMAERGEGGPFDPKAMEALQAQTDQQVHDLLGDDKFQQYQDYRKDMQEHMRVTQLDQRLTDSGQSTLSQAQQEQLFGVLKQEKGTIPAPTPASYGSRADFNAAMTDWRNAYDQRVQDRVAGLLTPEQLAAFKEVRRPPGPPPRVPR